MTQLLTAAFENPLTWTDQGILFGVSDDPACSWHADAPTLGSCTNRNDVLWNAYHDPDGPDVVRVYWGPFYTGAWFCLEPERGYASTNDASLTFDLGWDGDGRELPGFGQSVWHNAASAKWAYSCIGEG